MKPTSVQPKLIAYILIPSLVLVVILTVALREMVYQTIIVPLAYAWSILVFLLSSTPQAIFWGIFILIAFFIVLRTLLAGKEKEVALPTTIREDSLAPTRDHIYHWTIQVQLAVHGNLYFRDRVMRSLERVVMGVIGYQERLTFKEVEDAMAHRSLEVPTDIARLFDFKSEDGRKPADGKIVHLLKVWAGGIQSLFNRLVLRKETPDEYSQLEEIIDYLETQLEIKHGS